MMDKVLLVWLDPDGLDASIRERVERHSGGRRVVFTASREEVARFRETVDIVLGDFPRDLLPELPNLIWFQQFGTGVEWLQQNPRLADARFRLTNCSDDHYSVVADHFFALMLAVLRGIPRFVLAQSRGSWETPPTVDDPSLHQLRGKTMLVVGLGSIGREIVRRGAVFGLSCIGVRRDPEKAVEGVSKVYGMEALNLAAARADIVAACLPGTDQTAQVFDEAFFAALGPTGFFVNVGRGTSVDEDALGHALQSGLIAGAGADVFAKEPLAASSSLWSCPNMLITPHAAACYAGVTRTWTEVALDNLKRFNHGQPLRNLVDKRLGY